MFQIILNFDKKKILLHFSIEYKFLDENQKISSVLHIIFVFTQFKIAMFSFDFRKNFDFEIYFNKFDIINVRINDKCFYFIVARERNKNFV